MSVMYLDSRKYKEPSQDKERPKCEITQPPLKYPAVVLPWAVEASYYLFIYICTHTICAYVCL